MYFVSKMPAEETSKLVSGTDEIVVMTAHNSHPSRALVCVTGDLCALIVGTAHGIDTTCPPHANEEMQFYFDSQIKDFTALTAVYWCILDILEKIAFRNTDF